SQRAWEWFHRRRIEGRLACCPSNTFEDSAFVARNRRALGTLNSTSLQPVFGIVFLLGNFLRALYQGVAQRFFIAPFRQLLGKPFRETIPKIDISGRRGDTDPSSGELYAALM